MPASQPPREETSSVAVLNKPAWPFVICHRAISVGKTRLKTMPSSIQPANVAAKADRSGPDRRPIQGPTFDAESSSVDSFLAIACVYGVLSPQTDLIRRAADWPHRRP